jgi:hypothetical protein
MNKSFLTWLDELPLIYVLLPALLLGVAPWPAQPEPHLVEKLRMLMSGTLTNPVDIFDLFFHSAPALLLAVKLVRDVRGRKEKR